MISARSLAFASTILSFSGIVLLGLVLVLFHVQQVALASPVIVSSHDVERVYEPATIHGTPVEVSVPSLGIDVRVDKGYYDPMTGLWSITEEAAYYAVITDRINNRSGSTFIYGHNSNKIFGNLRQIKDGAVAHVRTDNGYVFNYTPTGYENVAPTDGDKLAYDGDTPRLVLQTCSGAWNQTRQLTYFTLTSYEKQ